MSVIEKFSRAAATWVPEGDGKKHAGVFIPCPASIDTRFPRKKEDKSPAHITFIYIGPVAEEKHDAVVRIVREGLATMHPPVRVSATKLDHFDNPAGKSIAHLVPEFSQDLRAARSSIISALEAEGVEVLDKGKLEWKPHITLKYLAGGKEWKKDPPRAEWSFSDMEIWGLPEAHILPLGIMDKTSSDSVMVDDAEITFPLSLGDALATARAAEGEHWATGVAPITEDVFDIIEGVPKDQGSATLVAYSTYSNSDKKRLLSKLPVEALHALLIRRYQGRWWRHEPEVILQDLAEQFNFILDAGGINRVRALHAICDAPVGQCPFYRDAEAFRFLSMCLSGRAVRADTVATPSPHEMALAIHVTQPIRPGPFTHQVLGFIAAACYSDGLWAPTDVLEIAQPKIVEICFSIDAPVDEDRINRVVALSIRERETDGAAIPDTLRDEDDVQALRIIDFEDGVQEALEHGEDVAESVAHAWDSEVNRGE